MTLPHPSPSGPLAAPAPRALPVTADPVPLPRDEPPALPEEILLESRGVLTRRLLRSAWRFAIPLVILWVLLVVGYVQSSAPTLWAISPLYLLDPGISVGLILRIAGFTGTGVGLALVLVPLLGTALSLALVPLASAWAARVNPRRHRSAALARSEVRRRIALVLTLPPAAVIALLLAAVLLPVELQWHELSYGIIAGFAGGIGLTWATLVVLRAVAPIDALLAPDGPVDPDGRGDAVHAGAGAGAGAMRPGGPALVAPGDEALAADPRPLPPSTRPDTVAVAARSLRIIGRRMLTYGGGVTLALVWLVLGIADAVVFFTRMGSAGLDAGPRTGLPGPTWMIGGGILLLAALAVAVSPLVGMAAARSLRAGPTTMPAATFTPASAVHHHPPSTPRIGPTPAATGPWEARVARVGALAVALALLAAVAVLGALLGLIGALDNLAVTWLLIDAFVLVPLAAAATHAALRDRLRDIVHGPLDLYARRRARWALIAPAAGTRTQAASDPVVRARRVQLELAQQARSGRSDLAPVGGAASSRRRDAAPTAAPGALPDFGHADERRPSGPPALGGRGTGIPEDVSDLHR